MQPTAQCNNDSGSGRVEEAGEWYRENRENCPHPVIPYLMLVFGLSGPKEAIEAIRLAVFAS